MGDRPSQALQKRSSDSILMPPPPPPKRQKRPPKVIDEDVYADALSHIVARDFFPGLLETEAQQEYMQALDSKNTNWIREAGRRLTQVMTPGPDRRSRMARATSLTPRRSTGVGDTPRGWVGETPARTPKTEVKNDFAPEEKPEVDVNMSLSAFQAKYTSEDNESFNELLDKQNLKRASTYAFFHAGNKIPSAQQIAHRARERKALEAASGNPSNALITKNAAGEERQAVAPARPSQDLSTRPSTVNSFPDRQGPRNHFMFGPEGIEDTHTTYFQAAEARSNAPPKSVTYNATRFQPSAAKVDDPVPPSPSISAIDAAIGRRSQKPADSEPGYSGAETPRVAGYSFVDADPTPSELGVPVTDEEADAAEQRSAMAFLPKPDETGPNPFKVQEQSKREDIRDKLVEKADAGRRKAGRLEQLQKLGVTNATGRTPTPRFSTAPTPGGKKSVGAMTPAARMLAENLGKTPKRTTEDGFRGANGKDWTPTPKIKRTR
ncbi:hypothetical protein KC332_g15184 [Hortaea werneckii]|uniref:Nuclear protein DGCR14 n=2 Tax=Hortaea werneckii TaxID=91943 RepID=A0A3M7IBV6_HORWE|nr:hypothetical protein KC358_g15164 [Hortaea werneckii]OTA30946.1 hypothetical protein BTJ68_10133 [Hortaea werneckii EXF-2000]KAI6804653.1 hypothetical protein KC350_g14941 [Hortaea werneckii]KAI6904914.1 hypothetical protein KC348_g15145 [Hortaea werneckii]KAI6965311.1 hypothetical protein KC329_g15284 [Hortaea werneckii]